MSSVLHTCVQLLPKLSVVTSFDMADDNTGSAVAWVSTEGSKSQAALVWYPVVLTALTQAKTERVQLFEINMDVSKTWRPALAQHAAVVAGMIYIIKHW